MKRRGFLASVGALLMPLVAGAQQQGKMFRVGVLSSGRSQGAGNALGGDSYLGALTERLRDFGYGLGINLQLDKRYAEGKLERLPALAAELVAAEVDAILAAGNPAVQAARHATKTIPIVMISADPVAAGFVPKLAHPGGNLTGLSVDAGLAIWSKRLQLLKECAPAVRRVGVLSRTGGQKGAWVQELGAAASRLGVALVHAGAQSARDFTSAFAALSKGQIDALIASDTPLNVQYRHLIIEFASSRRLPAVYANREAAEDGGLMAYGVNLIAIYRNAATYIDRIFKGAVPGELPVEQPTQFEMVINMKTARALGLTIPQSVLIRASRVIE